YVELDESIRLPAQERVPLAERLKRGSAPAVTAPRSVELAGAHKTHTQARALTRSFMDDVRLGRGIDGKEIKTTVSECVRSVLRNPDAMLWMGRLRDKSEYTSEHCLNVGLLAVAFGRHLGASEEDLNHLGVAGMLHDIGKMQTPDELLKKNA